jgi:hypothetical protein
VTATPSTNRDRSVGEHLDPVGLDSIEGLLGDRLRTVFGRVDQSGHVGVDVASLDGDTQGGLVMH